MVHSIGMRLLPVIFGSAAALVVGLGIGATVGTIRERSRGEATLDETLGMAWGSGKYGEAFYGMRTFVRAEGNALSVRGEVRIGPGNGMIHDCGVIGAATSRKDAVERFGTITWRPDGVHVGPAGRDEYFLSQGTVETHR